jgi:hypothetical protein
MKSDVQYNMLTSSQKQDLSTYIMTPLSLAVRQYTLNLGSRGLQKDVVYLG